MKNNKKHLALNAFGSSLLISFALFFLQSCNTPKQEAVQQNNLIVDTIEAQLQCFDTSYSVAGNEVAATNRILASIVFSGTIKEMGIAKGGVKILVYDATEHEYTSGTLSSAPNGAYTFNNPNVTYPVKVVVDNGNAAHYLEVITLKAPALTAAGLPKDTSIDFNILPYEGGVNANEHNLSVRLKKGVDGSALVKRKVTFSSDVLGNTWHANTDSRGIVNFTHPDKKAGVYSVYTDQNSVPNFNFSTLGLIRKANIRTEITLVN